MRRIGEVHPTGVGGDYGPLESAASGTAVSSELLHGHAAATRWPARSVPDNPIPRNHARMYFVKPFWLWRRFGESRIVADHGQDMSTALSQDVSSCLTQ
jgi:hypothetical protein